VLTAKALDHEYAGILGVPDFVKSAQSLVFGSSDHPLLKEKRVVTAQAISGTGALRIAGAFLGRFAEAPLLYSNPTWGNHIPIFKDAGLANQTTYRYFDKATGGLDFAGMKEDLNSAANGSIVLLHACAHNPTGVDPSQEQWKEISHIVKKKGMLPLFDMAYQGFASGDLDRDAWAVRHFIEDGHDGLVVTQSFAKNMGLYGERVGAVSFICANDKEAANVDSQVKIVVRPMYSNPPVYGARLASIVMNDATLNAQWRDDLKVMSGRISAMRKALVEGLKREGSTRNWSHITSQIGMFCFTGLTPEQCDKLTKEFHVYLTRNGRISIAGVTPKNVEYLAKAIKQVSN